MKYTKDKWEQTFQEDFLEACEDYGYYFDSRMDEMYSRNLGYENEEDQKKGYFKAEDGKKLRLYEPIRITDGIFYVIEKSDDWDIEFTIFDDLKEAIQFYNDYPEEAYKPLDDVMNEWMDKTHKEYEIECNPLTINRNGHFTDFTIYKRGENNYKSILYENVTEQMLNEDWFVEELKNATEKLNQTWDGGWKINDIIKKKRNFDRCYEVLWKNNSYVYDDTGGMVYGLQILCTYDVNGYDPGRQQGQPHNVLEIIEQDFDENAMQEQLEDDYDLTGYSYTGIDNKNEKELK